MAKEKSVAPFASLVHVPGASQDITESEYIEFEMQEHCRKLAYVAREDTRKNEVRSASVIERIWSLLMGRDVTAERLTVDQVAGKVGFGLRHLGSGALQSWLRGRARVGCGLAAVVMATLAPVVMAVDASPRRVLMVYSFGRDFMPYAATAIQFRSELARLSPQPVEFRDASLELARFDATGQDGPLLDYLRAVYAEHRPDLIVPIGAQAAMFCQRHRQELFPEAPLLLVGVDDRRLRGMLSEPGVTSVGLDMDVSRFVGNILEVRPNTQDIYVVIGSSPLAKFWEQAFRREWAQFSDRVTLHWWSDRSIAKVCESVRNLPPNSAVLITVVRRAGIWDHSGTTRSRHRWRTTGVTGKDRIRGGETRREIAGGRAGCELAGTTADVGLARL
jgi:hypothetical protein